MSASFYDLLKFAKTGIASPSMTHYDKQKALSMCKAGFPVKTLTGVPPIPFDSDGTPLIAWTVVGNEVQTGTPTPSVPIQPEECGDKTGNLCSVNAWKNELDTDTRTFLQCYIILFHERTNIGFYFANVLTIGTFSITTSPTSDTITRIIIKHNGASNDLRIAEIRGNWSAGTIFTLTANCIGNDPTVLNGIELQDIMLNTGSTAQPYEPFGYKIPITLDGQTQNIYLSEPLRKIGGYGDTVEQDGTVTRRVKKKVLDGTESWNVASTNLFNASLPGCKVQTDEKSMICTHYNGTTSKTAYSQLYDKQCCTYSGQMWIRDSSFNLQTFKQYLSDQYAAGTPVTAWYAITTPTTEQITVPTLTPTKGSNTLSVGTTLQPSSVSITGGIK